MYLSNKVESDIKRLIGLLNRRATILGRRYMDP